MDAAEFLIQSHGQRAHEQHRTSAAAEALIMHALLEQRRGRHRPALEALREAIPLSRACGLQRTWLDAGEPLRRLVRRALASGLRQELAPSDADFLREQNAGGGEEPGEFLTAREFDVLGELSAGGSNKQIGRRLGLSENTVKTHLKSLFGKLGVDGRRQAVEVARALGLA
jgi:LuxR family maltose regulon positive regulatory protein